MRMRDAGLMALGSVMLAAAAPSAAQETATPIVVETKFVTLEGQERQAAVGDIVHEDERTIVHERLIVLDDVTEACTPGWCHNFKAGDEFVQVGYGPRIYCTLERTATRESLFASSPAHSCIARDFSKADKLEIFGLKEFEKSLRIQPSPKPSGIRIDLRKDPLAAYPDWGNISPPDYVDGKFIARFAGYEGGKILFDLEHVPAIEGSAEATVVRVGLKPNDNNVIVFPLPGEEIDYQELADSKGRRSDVYVYSGVRMHVKDVTADSLAYQVFSTNRYLQIFPGGYWLVTDKGEGTVSQTRYR